MRRAVAVFLVLATATVAACDGEGIGGGPRRGGTARIGIERVVSLDPGQARTPDQLLVADQLFDTLTTTAPGAVKAARPGLAASWSSSADQRTWEFTLGGDARFANGRLITAADVKYSFERVARRAAASPGAELLELVTGFAPFADGTAPELGGISAADERVVRITLEQPWAVLPLVLSSPTLGIVPRESVEAAPPAPPFEEQPVGSGPFRLGERSGNRIVLVPRPGAEVLLDRLEFVEFDSAAASYRAFERGQVDWSRVPPERAPAAARDHGDDGYRPVGAQLFYGFNLRNPLLADVRYREAVVSAIDRAALVADVYQGTALVSDGLIPRGDVAFQPEACRRCVMDVARSRRLLAEVFSGTAPPELQVDVDDDPSQLAVASRIVSALEAAGIPAAVRSHPVGEYRAFLSGGQQQLFRLGWISAYPSADSVLPPLFAKGSPSNLTGFDAPAVDEGLRAARAEPDADRRASLYQAAENAVLDVFPVVPLAQLLTHTVAAGRLRGLEVDGRGGFDGASVWIGR